MIPQCSLWNKEYVKSISKWGRVGQSISLLLNRYTNKRPGLFVSFPCWFLYSVLPWSRHCGRRGVFRWRMVLVFGNWAVSDSVRVGFVLIHSFSKNCCCVVYYLSSFGIFEIFYFKTFLWVKNAKFLIFLFYTGVPLLPFPVQCVNGGLWNKSPMHCAFFFVLWWCAYL